MKTIFSFFLCLIGFASFSQEDGGFVWTEFPNSKMITADNADSIKTYSNTIESVVNYFFASRIRKDKAWEKVVPKENQRSERLVRELVKYDAWEILKYRIISSTEFEPGKFWVRIYLQVAFNGRVKGGTDEVDIVLINDQWVITSVPN